MAILLRREAFHLQAWTGPRLVPMPRYPRATGAGMTARVTCARQGMIIAERAG